MEDNRLATDNQKIRAALLREQGYDISEENEVFPLARMTFLGWKSNDIKINQLSKEIQELKQKLDEKQHLQIRAIENHHPSRKGWDFVIIIFSLIVLVFVIIYLCVEKYKISSPSVIVEAPARIEPVVKKKKYKKVRHVQIKQDNK